MIGARAAVGLLLCALLATSLARAQPAAPAPKGTVAKPSAAAQPAPIEPAALRQRIEHEIDGLRSQMQRAATAAAPPGVSPTEVANAAKAAALLLMTYEEQVDSLAQTQQQQAALEVAERAERDWPGFGDKQPHAILLRDELLELAHTQRATAALLKSSREVIDIEFDRLRGRAQQAAEALRRATEAVDTAPAGSDARAAAAWRLDAARGQARLGAELLVASNLAAQALDSKIAVAEVQGRLAQRKLAELPGSVTIDRADVEEAGRRLEAARTLHDRQLQALVMTSAQAMHEREQASKALEALRKGSGAADKQVAHERALLLAQARLRAAEARVQSAGQQARIESVLVNLYHSMTVESWDWRYTALAGTDAQARQEALRRLAGMAEYLKLWESRATIQLNEARSALREQDQRVQAAFDPELAAHERSAREALRDLDLAFERQHELLTRRLAQLDHWQQEFPASLRARSLPEIGADVWVRLQEAAQRVWNTELLAIEDKVEVGGKTVTTSRGITVGKSIGAVLLFLIGYRLLGWLTRRLERLLVSRFHIAPEQGKTIRRWTQAICLVALLLLTLNLARIPLTVFAFAGGALAIGIGFGTQNLIKNLISGMLVLVERHVRVGDLIEVAGVTGRVTAVDVRSSTVRASDGAESLIPNAMLLEQRVTNWTLNDANVQRVVKVGVAYGAPAHKVARILSECAERHDEVLEHPPVSVVLDDFGEHAMEFSLRFWIDLTSRDNSAKVRSDLRFAIEEQLREAGIRIASPRSEVHLDAQRPLKVEVMATATAKPGVVP